MKFFKAPERYKPEISPEMYEKIIENAGECIAFLDTGGKVLDINKSVLKITGRKKEDIIGRNFAKLGVLDLNMLPSLVKIFKDVLAGKPVKGFRMDLKNTKGQRIPIEVSSMPAKMKDGRKGIVVILKDITERKKAEEKIRESERKYRLSFDNSRDAINIFSKERKILDLNKELIALSGYSEKELLSMKLEDLFPEAKKPETAGRLKKMLSGKEIPLFKTHIRTKKGRDVPVEIGVTVLKNCYGRDIVFQGNIRDITERKQAEKKIRESEERWRVLFEYAPDAIYINDLKGNLMDGNSAAEKLTGYKREELVGKSFFSLNILPKDQIPRAASLLARNIAGKPTGPDEFTLIRKDGSRVDAEISTYPVKIAGKRVVLGIARDITERKKAEEAIKESEERYRVQFDEALDAIFVADAETGIIVDCNRAATRLFGRDKSELIGQQQSILHPPGVIKGGLSETFRKHLGEAEGQTLETRIITKGGKIKDVVIKANLIELKGKKFLQGIFRDITEQKKIQDEIKKSRDFLKTIIETSSSLVVGLDPHGKIKLVNHALEEMTGYTKKEILGKNWFDTFLPEDTKKEIKRVFADLVEGKWKMAKHQENPILTKSGEERIIFWSNNIIKDEKGRTEMVVSIGSDVTERKRMEEELKNRIEEAERFTKLSVGRELRMIELKKRIRELERELKKRSGD